MVGLHKYQCWNRDQKGGEYISCVRRIKSPANKNSNVDGRRLKQAGDGGEHRAVDCLSDGKLKKKITKAISFQKTYIF